MRLPRFLSLSPLKRASFGASPTRALFDASLVGCVLLLILLLTFIRISPLNKQLLLTLFIDPVCMLVFALRMRLFQGRTPLRRFGLEMGYGAIAGCVFGLVWLLISFPLDMMGVMRPAWQLDGRVVFLVIPAAIANIGWFAILRIVGRIYFSWDRRRRRQLQWALTHAHIMVLASGAGLLILLLDTLIVISSLVAPGNIKAVAPATAALATLSVIALMIIIPPAALVSYIVVKRITSRLKTLTEATGALHRGDYSVRITVVGEDEVAQLQSDFNAMADSLEGAVRELQDERDRVSGLLQARRELVANVSHELRTPVATIRGYLETTIAHWDELSPQTVQHDLEVMEHEAIRLQVLIEDLFALARADVGRLILQCKPTDAGALVRHIVDTAAPLIWRASKITLAADAPDCLPPVMVDPSRLEQALQNLLHNAVRHTSPGGIVAIVVRPEAEAIVIHVKDTGEGIAASDLPHIWQRFYQTASARTRLSSGTGLGLALVKEWIEGMQGTVTVESVLGEGSCFTITLPISGKTGPRRDC